MPRKPSSIYVIVEQAGAPPRAPGIPVTPPTSLAAWRIPLDDGDTVDADALALAKRKAVDKVYGGHRHSMDAMVVAVEDTKVQAFKPTLGLEEIDDPRITEEERED